MFLISLNPDLRCFVQTSSHLSKYIQYSWFIPLLSLLFEQYKPIKYIPFFTTCLVFTGHQSNRHRHSINHY